MAKALAPDKIVTKAGTFVTNVLPDPFDERDLQYRPRLQPLPSALDRRKDKKAMVLEQKGSSCVGHALAAMINTVLAYIPGAPPKPKRVSPYMLYWLARRYDEFEGEEDVGSSLRGGLVGWFHHGCALEPEWKDLATVRDLDDRKFRDHCAERPLGAFYRINAYRLDDMQSAVNELNVIVASAAIHDGWEEPQPMSRGKGGETFHTIVRRINPVAVGGHAFAIVGYNELGFLVQNSWGQDWGKGGFATLPYEDWLDSAYDAWVARPGVPQTPFAHGRDRATIGTRGALTTGPGPDLRRLAAHVVNLGNDGRLSTHGLSTSSPTQIDGIFQHMDEVHKDWAQKGDGAVRRVVLFAHGGLVSEGSGLDTAQRHLNWWMNNHVYPVSFVWQSGAGESIINQIADLVKTKIPFGGVGFDFAESFDRFVEKVARNGTRFLWDEMKENARRASQSLDKDAEMSRQPGATLAVQRLAKYIQDVKDVKGQKVKVAVHLVCHSAGSIFLGALLSRLAEAKISVETFSLLAPAIRVDDFRRDVLPHLGKAVKRTSVFVLSDQREQDDWLEAGGIRFYQKSLLYLVSRALEREAGKERFEVPLLGMARFFDDKLRTQLTEAGGSLVVAPQDGDSDAKRHPGFADESVTMTSVVLWILAR